MAPVTHWAEGLPAPLSAVALHIFLKNLSIKGCCTWFPWPEVEVGGKGCEHEEGEDLLDTNYLHPPLEQNLRNQPGH